MCRNPFCFNHHRNVEKTTQARLRLAEIVDGKQFLNAVANISIWKETPKYHPCDNKLFCAKYEERLTTFALNEVLGRPVPNVINLYYMLEEASTGDFARLDKTLGFVDNEGKEVEMAPLEQQYKMNDIMMKILEAKGVVFYSLIYRISIDIYEETQLQKKQKIRKLKLQNQRQLGAVTKTVSQKSSCKESEENGSTTRSKIKTAKDHEHYRKSQRPARL